MLDHPETNNGEKNTQNPPLGVFVQFART